MINKAKAHGAYRDKNSNALDGLTDGLIMAMKYCDATIDYPTGSASKGDGVRPEWFLDNYKSTKPCAEINAILQYTGQSVIYGDIGELLLGISMVEMKHYDKLGELITDLGGTIKDGYTAAGVNYGTSSKNALSLGIEAEKATIERYNWIVDKINQLPKNKTTEYCLALLAKLIADENYHIMLLTKELNSGKVIKLKSKE